MTTQQTTGAKQLRAGEGRAFALMGSSLTFKYEPADNGDAMLTFEHFCPPGLGVPPHHERNHEAFHVLEGTLEVDTEDRRHRLEPGDFLFINPGVVHSLHNPGPGPLRVLTVVSPGQGHVRFFSTLGQPIDDPLTPPRPSGPPDFNHVQEVASDCGIEFLPPTDTEL